MDRLGNSLLRPVHGVRWNQGPETQKTIELSQKAYVENSMYEIELDSCRRREKSDKATEMN